MKRRFTAIAVVFCAAVGIAVLGTLIATGFFFDKLEKGNAAYRAGDYPQALAWYGKAADEGDAEAQAMVGILYARGLGVERDDAQALQWFFKAANQGSARALSLLGDMYSGGRGVQKDDEMAADFYSRSAQLFQLRGDPFAQVSLGVAYLTGRGVQKDYNRAFEMFKSAADKGDQSAQYNLALMLQQGLGAPRDEKQAEEWYLRACKCDFSLRAVTDLLKFFDFREGALGSTGVIVSWPKQNLVYAVMGDLSLETTPIMAETMKRLSSITGLKFRREISGGVDISIITDPKVLIDLHDKPQRFHSIGLSDETIGEMQTHDPRPPSPGGEACAHTFFTGKDDADIAMSISLSQSASRSCLVGAALTAIGVKTTSRDQESQAFHAACILYQARRLGARAMSEILEKWAQLEAVCDTLERADNDPERRSASTHQAKPKILAATPIRAPNSRMAPASA